MPSRAEYNECIAEQLRGKSFSPTERRKEFCIASKLCSNKASSREEAKQICEVSMSKPKERKTKRGRRTRLAQVGMRIVLLTTTDCRPCTVAKEYLKDKLESGEIEELNIQKSDEAADLAAKHGFQSVPKLLVLDKDGKPFSELQITDTEQTI